MPRKRRRWWRTAFVVLVALLGLVLAAPHAIAIDAVREQIEAQLRRELGVPCRIGQLGFSWFTGLAVVGLEIGNPPGFAPERPCLRCKRAAADLSLLPMLRGRFGLDAVVDNLEIYVEQDADGTTNFERLFRLRFGSGHGREVSLAKGRRDLGAWRLHLQARESVLQFRREGELLESLSDIVCSVKKGFDSQRVAVDLDTKLMPITSGVELGRLGLEVAVDAGTGAVDAVLSTAGLDLGRYEPLLTALFPGQVTGLAGVANGAMTVRQPRPELITIDGSLSVFGPRVSGDLVAGMDVHSERWTLTPVLRLRRSGTSWQVVDADRLAIDLGWFHLRGLAATTAAPVRPSPDALAFAYELDVDALSALGGPVPGWLEGTGSKVHGEIGIPRTFDPSKLDGKLGGLLEHCAATVHVTAETIAVAGLLLGKLEGTGSLRDRQFRFDVSEAVLDRGAVTLGLQIDLRGERWPSAFAMRWSGGQLQPAGVEVMRYLVPMFAGLDSGVPDLSGQCDLQLALQGPACAAPGQNWLHLLDEWAGSGTLGLRGATVTPAPALAGLLAPFGELAGEPGDAGTLAIDSFEAPFRLERGAIAMRAAKWLRKGKQIGVSGVTRLDGQLDLGFELGALLRGHRDGERMLQVAGGALPAARLRGTVDSPSLALPDIGDLLQKVLQRDLEEQASDALRRVLDNLRKRKT
ncbi:MAG TPA: hypothetical protein VFD82_11885 [Planctomycetota bacterium]|nr:hypothetical protein [Planctomycetota bacterium]